MEPRGPRRRRPSAASVNGVRWALSVEQVQARRYGWLQTGHELEIKSNGGRPTPAYTRVLVTRLSHDSAEVHWSARCAAVGASRQQTGGVIAFDSGATAPGGFRKRRSPALRRVKWNVLVGPSLDFSRPNRKASTFS